MVLVGTLIETDSPHLVNVVLLDPSDVRIVSLMGSGFEPEETTITLCVLGAVLVALVLQLSWYPLVDLSRALKSVVPLTAGKSSEYAAAVRFV